MPRVSDEAATAIQTRSVGYGVHACLCARRVGHGGLSRGSRRRFGVEFVCVFRYRPVRLAWSHRTMHVRRLQVLFEVLYTWAAILSPRFRRETLERLEKGWSGGCWRGQADLIATQKNFAQLLFVTSSHPGPHRARQSHNSSCLHGHLHPLHVARGGLVHAEVSCVTGSFSPSGGRDPVVRSSKRHRTTSDGSNRRDLRCSAEESCRCRSCS